MQEAIEASNPVFVSSVTVVEVVYLVEKDRLPSVALQRLIEELSREEGAGGRWPGASRCFRGPRWASC
jgi:hypothetical protein